MHPRRSTADQDAISRRLALLGDELAGVRPARPEPAADLDVAPEGDHWWDEHTHVAPSRRPPPPRPRPLPATPAPVTRLPVPGRHADRRRVPGIALAAPQLAVVAVVVTVALAVTCWWLVRGRADPADPVTAAVQAAPAPGLVTPASAGGGGGGVTPVDDATAAPTAGTRPATVTVDVAGKVRHPGIAVLDAGARVVDALQAAGGTRPGVDLTGLNLARVLVDGEQVVVGVEAPTGVAAAATGTATAVASPGGPATLVDLNTAGQDDLDSLPEVGPVTAASILAWREQNGGFTSVDELLEVDGIGEVTLAKIAPYVTV